MGRLSLQNKRVILLGGRHYAIQNTMCEEISGQLQEVEKLLIEIDNSDEDDFGNMLRSSASALNIVQDLLYDLR